MHNCKRLFKYFGCSSRRGWLEFKIFYNNINTKQNIVARIFIGIEIYGLSTELYVRQVKKSAAVVAAGSRVVM